MKKIIALIITITIAGGMFIGCSSTDNKEQDINVKGTKIYFGNDKRYCLKNINNTISLKDIEKDNIIDFGLINYKEIKPYLYTASKDWYTKLNYENSKFEVSDVLSDFSKEDQQIFKELKHDE